ncbi:hypothetical protein KOR34_04700 [Posidoniimonas corsicana]|uniref:PEP-CTERM protein-sorting domain-containing protein n=1 Tax=Posidoniimonas corsicana TaxID=1938618 RepID=A0A5C5VC86_9BACT|nr:hypothetical protein [Posidoniimonas corsicana]TWT35577.1 hypothetical protein KOR34_04700 [Posidoniimonas corsicana]
MLRENWLPLPTILTALVLAAYSHPAELLGADLAPDAQSLNAQTRGSVIPVKGYRVEVAPFAVSGGRVLDMNDSRQLTYFVVRGGNDGFWYDGQTVSNLDPGIGREGIGLAINNAARVAGTVYGGGAGTRPQAAIWDDGVLQVLGQFGGTGAEAGAVNETGLIAGWFELSRSAAERRLFTWHGGQFVDWGPMPSVRGTVRSMNDAGEVVGHADGSLLQGWSWRDGEFTTLPDLAGGDDTAPADINASGVVVGGSYIDQAEIRAVKWIDSVVEKLPHPADALASDALSINDAGLIVGSIQTPEGNRSTAMIWEDDRFYDLETLVPDLGGWRLNVAREINNDGAILVDGISPTNTFGQVFLIPIPEPSAAVLMAAAMGLALSQRRCGWSASAQCKQTYCGDLVSRHSR